MAPLEMHDVLILAENRHYLFCVGRVGSRWIGFARGKDGTPMLFLFPEVAVGVEMGVADREYAIRLTGALASDPESSYGRVKRWYVPPELRGNPDDFRCRHCGRVGCDGEECEESFADYDFPGEDSP